MITFDEAQAKLDEAIERYQQAVTDCATESIRCIVALCAEEAPTARWVWVDTTDQDTSGALVCERITDDADNELEVDEDALWGPLSNLDDRSEDSWKPYATTDSDGRNMRLDLLSMREVLA